MMMSRIRAGSRTTDSLPAILLWPLTSESVSGSVTVHPWNSRSPVDSSMNTAGQWLVSVSGSIAMNFSAMAVLPGRRLRCIAHPSTVSRQPRASQGLFALYSGGARTSVRCV